VAWWAVQTTIISVAVLLRGWTRCTCASLGIDEHRYRRVPLVPRRHRLVARVEPWMSTIVNADCGNLDASAARA
jgi:hypothetical protein